MRHTIYSALTLFTAAIILYVSMIRDLPGLEPPTLPHLDKLGHFLAYALLSFLLFKRTGTKKHAFLIAGTFGLAIEVIQYFIPYRSFDVLDITVNFLGAGTLYLKKLPRDKKRPAP